jgi:hypothetical protein
MEAAVSSGQGEAVSMGDGHGHRFGVRMCAGGGERVGIDALSV